MRQSRCAKTPNAVPLTLPEEEQKDGRILKGLKFRFPVFFEGQEIQEFDWDDESTVEMVCQFEKTVNI